MLKEELEVDSLNIGIQIDAFKQKISAGIKSGLLANAENEYHDCFLVN